jgi:hypothetical protein
LFLSARSFPLRPARSRTRKKYFCNRCNTTLRVMLKTAEDRASYPAVPAKLPSGGNTKMDTGRSRLSPSLRQPAEVPATGRLSINQIEHDRRCVRKNFGRGCSGTPKRPVQKQCQRFTQSSTLPVAPPAKVG